MQELAGLNEIKINQPAPVFKTNDQFVKYLEKNGIGRPSTYASIINKVIERKYVEIKDIEGIKILIKSSFFIKDI